MRLFPRNPPPGPAEESFWQSPIRGPWLTSFLGSLLFPLVVLVGFTGFMSHAAYNPNLGANNIIPRDRDLNLLLFDWPTHPSWLYALNQGTHTIVGLVVVPLIFAKLWSVFPKLFAWPPIASPAKALERISMLLLVGGAAFQWATGLLNSQLYYPWHFSFVNAHYYGAWVFLGALFVHVGTKLTTIREAYRERGVLKPLMDDVAHTEPEPYVKGGLAPEVAEAPTISRRGLLALVGASSAGLFLVTAGQSIGGPFRELSLLGTRGRGSGFPVNKTAATARITEAMVGPAYRFELMGATKQTFTRQQLAGMRQYTEDLPIACVEGWSTTQRWTGVRVRDLAGMAGIKDGQGLLVESLQQRGVLRQVTLSHDQVMDDRSLLALQVNGADLPLDHGYPARIIIPGQPGVHNTKWVTSMKVVNT